MRRILLLIFLGIGTIGYGQTDSRISTVDFVQILNDNRDEAIYYYQNNWQILRIMAKEKGYIDSYEVLETPFGEDAPFQLMLITTYLNKDQYELREERFAELIKEKGALKLLNSKKPVEFRKTLFNKETVRHWSNTD